MNEEAILDVADLSVTIENEALLNNISFTLARGQALAVIGPNGAGKTTLFRALLGLVPYRGTITWHNGRNIGYVPQRLSLEQNLPLSVREFLLLKAQRFWFPDREFITHLQHELSLVGLSQAFLQKSIGTLSGGQFQRVLIAWAMLNHPDVLLFDEPTAGIDIGFEETIYTVMHRLQKERGTTILLISHDLDVVWRHADQVLCLNKTMVCYGKPDDVLHEKALGKLYGEVAVYRHTK